MNKKDWLIVLLNDETSQEAIEKELTEACNKKELKLNGWRYHSDKKMLIFEGYPEETITKLSHIISGFQRIGIIQIDKEGIF